MLICALRSSKNRVLRDCRGAAALEFGLVATMVLALLLFAFDVGLSMLDTPNSTWQSGPGGNMP